MSCFTLLVPLTFALAQNAAPLIDLAPARAQDLAPPVAPPVEPRELARAQLAAHRHEATDAGLRAWVARQKWPDAPLTLFGRAGSGSPELDAVALSFVAAWLPQVDVIALDVGWYEGRALDRWIAGDAGELEPVLAQLAPWNLGDGLTTLARELRRANAEERAAKPVRVVGIGAGACEPALDLALSFYARVDPVGEARSSFALAQARHLGDARRVERFAALTQGERYMLLGSARELREMFREGPEEWNAIGTAADRAVGLRASEVLVQSLETLNMRIEPLEVDPRGGVLAENTEAALRDLPKGARMLALVQLRDLARVSDPHSFAALIAAREPSCIASAFASGELRALDPDRPSDAPRALTFAAADASSFEQLLAELAPRATCFDLRPLRERDAWTSGAQDLRSVGEWCGAPREAAWSFLPAHDFDALVFVPHVTSVRTEPTKSD